MKLTNLRTNWVTVVEDIDCNKLTNDEKKKIYFLFLERKILVFKKQNLSNKKLKEFCSIFGRVWDLSTERYSGLEQTKNLTQEDSFVEIVSESGILNKKRIPWHIDLTHFPSQDIPNRMLYAINISENVSGTRFVDTVQGFKLLDNKVKNILLNSIALCKAPYKTPWDCYVRRPALNWHPYHNKYSLIADETFTEFLDGLDSNIDYSNWFRSNVIEKMLTYETEYLHKWDVGDLMIYDNSSTMHCRSEFSGVRRLKRITWDQNWHKYTS